ncbi:polysaccharide lyase [Cerasicoccus frondis]|uniref:polysaccharide lyase n=1 Tax=Cerasicoccus frondis TaxID=490090 RepID=UPI0028528AD9|nr:polysaccharide lyase [Cerasicoccus frondis]
MQLKTTTLGVALLLSTTLAQATTSFSAGYEDGSLDSGYTDLELQMAESFSLQNVTNVHREGEHSLKAYLRYGDITHGGPRAETYSGRVDGTLADIGETKFYGFSVYIVSSWEFDDTNEDIVFQWYSLRDPCENQHKSPSMFLAIKRDEWVLRINADPDPCTMDNDPPIKDQVTLGPVQTGRWLDCVVKVHWSYGSDGLVEVWTKTNTDSAYTHVLLRDGPNCYNDENPLCLKWGIYKPSWNNGPTSVDKRSVWHDAIRVGDSFSEVEVQP